MSQENKSTLGSTEKEVASHSTAPDENGRHSSGETPTHTPHTFVVHYFTGLLKKKPLISNGTVVPWVPIA